MLLRFFILIVVFAVGVVIAIPVKAVITTFMGSVEGTGWVSFSSTEWALMGLFPIVFLVFSVFVNPMRRFLSGKHPWGDDEEDRRDEERRQGR